MSFKSLPRFVPLPLDSSSDRFDASKYWRDIGMLFYIAGVNFAFAFLYGWFWSMVDNHAPVMMFAMWSVLFMAWAVLYSVTVYRLRGHLRMLCFEVMWLIIGVFATAVGGNIAYAIHTPGPLLTDLGFRLVPRLSGESIISKVTNATPFLVFFPFIARLVFTRNHLAMRAFCRTAGMMYFLRGCITFLTSLPGPAEYCNYDSPRYTPPTTVARIFSHLSFMWGATITCGDLLYSGHTGWIVGVLMLNLYTWPRSWPLRRAMAVLSLAILVNFIFGTLGQRKHYSTDVALGLLMGYFIHHRFRDGWGAPTSMHEALRIGAAAANARPSRKDSSDGTPVSGVEHAASLHRSRSYHGV